MKNPLTHPLARNLDLDSPETGLIHQKIIRSKPFLQRIYQEWYTTIVSSLPDKPGRRILELGSGGGYLKEYIPGLITSEIQQKNDVNIVLDGSFLPFAASSLDAIVMVDVLHHLPDVDRFFKEALRCLMPGGRIVMLEPWVSKWSAVIYKHLHHEPYLPESERWEFPSTGPLSGANLALPWMIFKRDQQLFLEKYKELRIRQIKPDWPFLYLLSGGVSMRTLAPDFSYPFFRKIELLLNPVMEQLAMFATIVLEKQ